MWKKGEDLIIKEQFSTTTARILMNLFGFIALAFCFNKLAGMYYETVPIKKEGVIFCVIGILAGLWSLYFCFFPDEETITIGKEGINVERDGIIYPWEQISAAYTGVAEDDQIRNREPHISLRRSRRRKETPWYLHVFFKRDNEIVHNAHRLNNYAYNNDDIKEAIEYWSGRDIGEKEDWERDQYIDQLTKEGVSRQEAEESRDRISIATPLFQKASSSVVAAMVWTLTLSGLGAVVFGKWYSIPSAILPKFVYCLVLVAPPTLLTIKIGNTMMAYKLKRLKRKAEVEALSQEEFNVCLRTTILDNAICPTAINILLVVAGLLILYLILNIGGTI